MRSVGLVRSEVIARDRQCMAPVLDPEAHGCADQWGGRMDPGQVLLLEMDYVRRDAVGSRHELACDHVALCPGHHRGTGPTSGFVWATANRGLLAGYLRGYRDGASGGPSMGTD